MKKILTTLLIICFLVLLNINFGEEWVNYITSGYWGKRLYSTTFTFPYNLSEIEIQSMDVEINATDVNYHANTAGGPSGVKVKVDKIYVGLLYTSGDRPSTSVTTFTIDAENATKILSDGSISISTSPVGDESWYGINNITVKVFYTNKDGRNKIITKVPVPFGVVALSLVGVLFLLMRRYEN
ncbi:hypothetical protein [Methanotorris formicicus]|uniref:Uncharacterized protein n=1 Tax=Methanotorris formicicus Mc-S-70 TaxID=647171 RepID=H1KYI8_9EURY|nr:hypothetical protein [Methanotorris formicicus]EHP87028.1 hypothetical protein MetfoDRAFT_0861 [Methanotorris formicicus Mc-S-70]